MLATFGLTECRASSIPICTDESPVLRNTYSTSVWGGADSQPGLLPWPAVCSVLKRELPTQYLFCGSWLIRHFFNLCVCLCVCVLAYAGQRKWRSLKSMSGHKGCDLSAPVLWPHSSACLALCSPVSLSPDTTINKALLKADRSMNNEPRCSLSDPLPLAETAGWLALFWMQIYKGQTKQVTKLTEKYDLIPSRPWYTDINTCCRHTRGISIHIRDSVVPFQTNRCIIDLNMIIQKGDRHAKQWDLKQNSVNRYD